MSDNWWEEAPVAKHHATTALDALTSRGVVISNGMRTDADDARIRAQGYKPAANSLHKDRDAVDLLPGNSGLSFDQLREAARQEFGPDAWIKFHDGHVHVQVPGWGAAPDVTRNPALKEGDWWSDAPLATPNPEAAPAPAPAANLPPPLKENAGDEITRTEPRDWTPLIQGPTDQTTVVEQFSKTRTETDPKAEALITSMVRAGIPAAEAQARFAKAFPDRGSFRAADYNASLAWYRKNKGYKGSFAAVEYEVPLSNVEMGRNDFAHSGPGALVGNYNNAISAGVPVLIAGQEGNDFQRVTYEEHPVASITGDVVGGVTGAIATGGVAKAGVGAVAEGGSRLAPAAAAIASKPGAVQAAVDIGMGTTFGASVAGPGHRAEGAALGALLSVGGEVAGRKILAPAVRAFRGRGGAAVDVITDAADEAPPVTRTAAMDAEHRLSDTITESLDDAARGPAQRELPFLGSTDTRTADEIADAARGADPADFAPNGTSAAGKDGKVANININRIESTDDISRALAATEESFEHDVARRGVQTHEATQQLANDLGMTADDLLARRQGQALNAEQALAARNILAKSNEELSLLARVAKDNGGVEDLAAFQRGLIRHAAIQEQVTGMTAEAGRALNQFRIAASSAAVRGEALRAVVEGSERDLKKIAQAILDAADNPAAFRRAAAKWKPGKWDKFIEVYYASMLSGPQTHGANIIGNSIAAITQPLEQAVAAGLGGLRYAGGKVIGRNVEDRVLMSEVGARTVGMLHGAREGFLKGWRAFITGESSDAVTKVETARHNAIPGKLGYAVRTPLRALTAEDEFFKAVARRSEIAALAVKKARGEGLRGEAAKARIAELVAEPTPKMVEQAGEFARRMTFQNKLGDLGTRTMGLTNNHPWMKLFVPFVRTPVNLFKYAGERTPLALMSKRIRADLRAGGARRDAAVARMMVGTGLAMWSYDLARKGILTGNGPADPSAKRLLQADGWQPFSIKIGDRYYSYQRLDPFSTIIGTAADLAEKQSEMTEVQLEKSTALLIGSFLSNLDNKSFLDGVSDIFGASEQAMKGRPEEAVRMIQQRIAGIVVPAIVAQANQGVDPVWRSTGQDSFTGGVIDAIENRIPGLSDNNAPVRDTFGQESVAAGGPVGRALNPLKAKDAKDDPVVAAMRAADASIGRLSRRIKLDGEKVKLSDADWDRYQQHAGELTYRYIAEEIATPDWHQLDAEEQRKAIDEAKADARKDARFDLFGERAESDGSDE